MDLNWYYVIPTYLSGVYDSLLVAFGILLGFSVISGIFWRNNVYWRFICGILWFAFWCIIALAFTILGRPQSEEPQIELQLFWCVQDAWMHHNPMQWYLIVGNIVLFIPLGGILAIFFEQIRSWWKIALFGFLVSLSIEVTQYVFRCGLFELDDLFHNTLGCYLGYCSYCIILCIVSSQAWENNKTQGLVSCFSLLFVIGFFVIALWMGQPVFGWLI